MSDTNELSLFNTDKELPDFIAESNFGELGNEGVDAGDIAIPQLKVLQPMSKEVLSIPEAQAGKFFNTVSQEMFDSTYAVNIAYEREYGIFKKRLLGGSGKLGGFPTRQEALAYVETLDGSVADYDIPETGIHKLLLLDERGEAVTPAIMYCSGTAVFSSQNWNTEIKTKCKDVPRFAGVWKLEVMTKQNNQGTWYSFQPTWAGYCSKELFDEAARIRASMTGEGMPAVSAD